MNTPRYTEPQVLHGLLEAWQDFTGDDDPFDENTRIDVYMKANGSWDEIDFSDVFHGIERFFGFTCSHKEWIDFIGLDVAKRSPSEWEVLIGPTLTFGALARFISERAVPIASFDPISVWGRECAPAGIFTGLQQVANKVTGGRLKLGPSTKIIDVLRGHDLAEFWAQVRWMTKHSPPQLPAMWRNVTRMTGCLGALAVVAGLAVAGQTSQPLWVPLTLMGAATIYCMAWTYRKLTNPLPANIVTFGDLSMLIATDCSFSQKVHI